MYTIEVTNTSNIAGYDSNYWARWPLSCKKIKKNKHLKGIFMENMKN